MMATAWRSARQPGGALRRHVAPLTPAMPMAATMLTLES